MPWTTESGQRAPWNKGPYIPDRPEASAAPRTPEEIDREIRRQEQILAKSPPHQHGWQRQRLEALYHEGLGLEPPPRPPKVQLQPMSNEAFDANEQKRYYWEIVNSYPGAITYKNVPIAYDNHGHPIEWRTDEKVDPEVHALAIAAVDDVMQQRNSGATRGVFYDMIEARLKAEHGSDWNRPPHLRVTRELHFWELP